jgi:hypothetical protein
MNKLKEADSIYQQKLAEAKRLFDIHNYLRKPTMEDTRIVHKKFVNKLVGMGGTSDEMLQQTNAEDLQDICGLPVLIARRLAEIFQMNGSCTRKGA